MSTKQSDLDDYERPERPSSGGMKACDRPKCGVETIQNGPCDIPVVPGMDVCHRHLDRAFGDET